MAKPKRLADEDIEAIADRLHELLSKPKLRVRSAVDFDTKPVELIKKDDTVTKGWRLFRAACSNVSPDNMMDQRMPAPMLEALLRSWEREHK